MTRSSRRVKRKPSAQATNGALIQIAASVAMVRHWIGMPAASPTPMTQKTRIWIVEVGRRNALKSSVSAPAANTMAIASGTVTRRSAIIEWPTVSSTPPLAKVAPTMVSAPIRASAGQSAMARAAKGMPMTAPV